MSFLCTKLSPATVLSDPCVGLAAEKEPQQTWEVKGRRSRGSLDQLLAIQCQEDAGASLALICSVCEVQLNT